MKIYTFQKNTQMSNNYFKKCQYPHALGECKLNYFEIPPHPTQTGYHK